MAVHTCSGIINIPGCIQNNKKISGSFDLKARNEHGN